MEIKHFKDTGRGYFSAVEDGYEVGLMTYVNEDKNIFVIDHTEVAPAYEGRGIGRQMVFSAVGYAREHDVKIIPVCPFVKSLFMDKPEICDVLLRYNYQEK